MIYIQKYAKFKEDIDNEIKITEEYFISPYNETVNTDCMKNKEAASVSNQMSLVLETMQVDLVHRKNGLTCGWNTNIQLPST